MWAAEAQETKRLPMWLATIDFVLDGISNKRSAQELRWVNVSLPAVSVPEVGIREEWTWRGEEVSTLPSVIVRKPGLLPARIDARFPSWNLAPDLVVSTPLGPSPLWTEWQQRAEGPKNWALNRSEFPPAWQAISGIFFYGYSGQLWDPNMVLNKASWLSNVITSWAWPRITREVDDLFGGNGGTPPFDAFCAFVVHCLVQDKGEAAWRRATAERPDLFDHYWRRVADLTDGGEPVIVFLQGGYPFWSAEILDPDGWRSSSSLGTEWSRLCPEPSEEWVVRGRDRRMSLGARFGRWLGRRAARALLD